MEDFIAVGAQDLACWAPERSFDREPCTNMAHYDPAATKCSTDVSQTSSLLGFASIYSLGAQHEYRYAFTQIFAVCLGLPRP